MQEPDYRFLIIDPVRVEENQKKRRRRERNVCRVVCTVLYSTVSSVVMIQYSYDPT